MRRKLRRIMPICAPKPRIKSNVPVVKTKKIFSHESSEIKKVGKCYDNTRRKFSYHDVRFDIGMWADASKYLPIAFDLCHCKTKDKTVPGWYTGHAWDGSKLNRSDKVLYWKCNYNF